MAPPLVAWVSWTCGGMYQTAHEASCERAAAHALRRFSASAPPAWASAWASYWTTGIPGPDRERELRSVPSQRPWGLHDRRAAHTSAVTPRGDGDPCATAVVRRRSTYDDRASAGGAATACWSAIRSGVAVGRERDRTGVRRCCGAPGPGERSAGRRARRCGAVRVRACVSRRPDRRIITAIRMCRAPMMSASAGLQL
jgi:hypothetical protein